MVTTQVHAVRSIEGQRYRHLFENAPICIVIIDLTARPVAILEVNRRAELVYGYTATELVGMPADTLMPEESRPTALALVRQVRRGKTVTAETIHRHRDGTPFSTRLIAAPDPTISGHMIVTIEDITAQKQRRSEAEAIAKERLRIAQEIHDGVVQNLAGLRFKSALWAHRASEVSPELGAVLNVMQEVLIDAIADIRRAIFALRPVDLEKEGVFTALDRLVTDFGDHNQLVAKLVVSGSHSALPAGYELSLFRIIQEGLNNISQHAQARSVLVRLDVEADGATRVLVKDNGRGFEPHQLAPINRDSRFGLCQMRERVLNLGGTLDIHSAVGQGTELLITLPPPFKEGNHDPD